MATYFKISIIGSGNVAWHLARSLENYGHSILEIYSHTIKNAYKLCSKLYESHPKNDLNFAQSHSTVFIIAVKDKFIPSIVENIHLPPSAILLHTSGTESLETLKGAGHPHGVLYPIQTFTKSREVSFKEIPISIEASNPETLKVLKSLAETLSKKVFLHSTNQRRVIHLASVFGANFTNHMLTISKGLLESNNLSFDLIKPLIAEVIKKAFEIDPENAQTGPAMRKDFTTIDKHLNYLAEEPSLATIYKAITEDIIRTYED